MTSALRVVPMNRTQGEVISTDQEWAKIARYVAGECTPAEAESVRLRTGSDPAARAMFGDALRIWGATAKVSPIAMARRKQVVPRWAWGGGLAGLAAAAAVTFVVLQDSALIHPAAQASELRSVVTTNGRRATVVLKDGSKVMVGPASKLTYAADFGETSRVVTLEGEALFTVSQKSGSPFVVRASGAEATVLGTTFAVRKYPENRGVSIAVAEGRVSLGGTVVAAGQRGLLIPGEKTTVATDRTAAELGSDWARDVLVFRNRPLRELAADLSRRFDADVVVDDERLGNRVVSGEFSNETLDEALQLVSLTAGLHYEKSGQHVHFVNSISAVKGS